MAAWLPCSSSSCDVGSTLAGNATSVIELSADLEVARLGRGLWLHRSWSSTQEGPKEARLYSNGLVIVGDDAVVVVDTPWGEDPTRSLFDWIEAKFRLPVRAFVVTHSHDDRTAGIDIVSRRGIPVIGCAETARLALAEGRTAPSDVFEGERVMTLDDETIELFHPGAGHSADNVVVGLRRAGVVFGGCLVRPLEAEGLGNTADADLDAWPRTIVRVQERFPDVRRVVPGHGEVGDATLLDHTLWLLEEHRQ